MQTQKKKTTDPKTKQQTTQSSGPMALEQDSVHSFLFLSASNVALYRHFIFDFVIYESMLNTLSYSTLNKQYIHKFKKYNLKILNTVSFSEQLAAKFNKNTVG